MQDDVENDASGMWWENRWNTQPIKCHKSKNKQVGNVPICVVGFESTCADQKLF